MLDVFSGLRLVIKRRTISIDNAIFRCHWFFTSTLLVSFSLVITARQYVGQPIECHSVNKIPDSLLNSYCWVQSTFTVPQACNLQVGLEVPYPCIDNTRGREIKMFAYYQWVGIVLFIQGLLFHLPYYLWKVWENGLIKAITGGLRVAVLSDKERDKKKDIVVEYIHDHLGCHKRYALKYFLCEFICLINLLAQLWATNKFFDGQFLRYGLEVMQYSSSSISSQFGMSQSSSTYSSLITNSTILQQSSTILSKQKLKNPLPIETVVDPMTYIFPRITKCTYYDFGSSGDIQKHDALCLLPLNIINEKIYIALWFWFVILAILTLLVILYRLLAILSESVRCKGLISRCKLSSERDIRIICRHCDVGDWFLFYMVAENLDPLIMREIVASISTKIIAHFELKKELALMQGEPQSDDQYFKFKSSDRERYRASESFDESLVSTRRNSLADEVPIVKKVKKRSYAKRLWSMDLGSGELRQQLFGRQPPINPDIRYQNQAQPQQLMPTDTHPTGGEQTSDTLLVSAPPACQMPLTSAPPLQRRGSLTRTSSTSSGVSTSDSFIMEMKTISSSNSCLNNDNHSDASYVKRQSLLRHRNSHQQHAHHQSITSIRELQHQGSTSDNHNYIGLELG